MQQTTSSFQTMDGLKLHTIAWLPEGTPKAVLLLVHGYGEHSGRYAHVAERLTGVGYALYALDHRGHGQSGGERVYFADFNYPIIDLKRYFDQVKEAQPGSRYGVYGHSLGSLIALEFALRYQEQLTGLIISGCAINLDESVTPMQVAVLNVLNAIAPRARLAPAVPASGLSHDPAIVTGYDHDPLNVTGPLRVRMGVQMVTTGQKIRARLAGLRLPLLILHGEDDPVVPVSGSRTLYERAGSTDKTLKIYPGLFHEVHNEVDKETVLNDLVAWLDAHMTG